MLKVGLTGGIGSGKSTVAAVFETFGIPVYYSDERAKEIYFKEHIRPKVKELLGGEAYLDERTLHKKHISEKIFSDEKLLKQLNAIIHAEVKNDFAEFAKAHKEAKYIIKESALLIEADLLDGVDRLIVITSLENLRRKRVLKREGMTEEQFSRILKQQLPDTEKTKRADWVIVNDETNLIIPQLLEIHKSL